MVAGAKKLRAPAGAGATRRSFLACPLAARHRLLLPTISTSTNSYKVGSSTSRIIKNVLSVIISQPVLASPSTANTNNHY